MRVCTEARRHCIPNLRVRLIAIEPHDTRHGSPSLVATVRMASTRWVSWPAGVVATTSAGTSSRDAACATRTVRRSRESTTRSYLHPLATSAARHICAVSPSCPESWHTRERRGSRSTNRRSSQPKQCVQTSHTATRNLFSSWDRRVNTSSPLRGGPVQNGRCKAVIGNAERIMRARKQFYGCVKNRLRRRSVCSLTGKAPGEAQIRGRFPYASFARGSAPYWRRTSTISCCSARVPFVPLAPVECVTMWRGVVRCLP